MQALIECEAEFSYVDVLSNPDVRQNLPAVSEWPTFPQLFIGGELVGGCDIVTQLHASGDLKKLVDSVTS